LIEKFIELLQVANDPALRFPEPAGVVIPPSVVAVYGETVAGQIKAFTLLPFGPEH
jgi:hypothetical protein